MLAGNEQLLDEKNRTGVPWITKSKNGTNYLSCIINSDKSPI